ncbi:FUSC family protein [Pseudodesulfovibrio sp.]|uniref:FUSC family protein n=1 Tax=unclassified Pseudodesulfovibrio TaxID=2661612 RepID=UPI003B0034B9
MKEIDFNSTRSHIRHGIKTGLASVLAYVVAEALNFPFAYWASLSAVIVMQMSVADSIRMCWYRFSGTAVGAVIAAIAILVFPDNQPMTLLAQFLSIAFCAYMTRYNSRYKMAAITTTIVFLASMGEPGRLMYGMERVLEIAVGVTCAFLVSITLWPQRAGEALRMRLQRQFTSMATIYGELIEGFLKLQSSVPADRLDDFVNDMASNRELYRGVIRHERLLYRDDTRSLNRQMQILESCTPHLRAMLHSLNDPQGKRYEIIMDTELRTLTSAIQDALTVIGRGEIPEGDRLAWALDQANKKLEDLRMQGVTRRFTLQMLMKFFSFYHSQRFMAQVLLDRLPKKEAESDS